ARISLRVRIEPLIIYVAVEHFVPMSSYGKSETITTVVERALVQTRDNDHISSDAWQPAVNRNDARLARDFECYAQNRRCLHPPRHDPHHAEAVRSKSLVMNPNFADGLLGAGTTVDQAR